jgi:hypothetical protein
LKASLAKLQTGRSSTFYLTLGGELREATMARDPSVVAAEAAAGMRVRVERALAKAIASSRPGLCPADAAVAAGDGSLVHPGQQQQQQQHGNKITGKINKLKTNLNISCDPGTPPQEADFLRMYQEMAERRKQLEQEQEQQQQQQQRLEQHQRDQLQKFEKDRQLLRATGPAAPAPGHQPLQPVQKPQGIANFSITKYLNRKQNTSSSGYVAKRTTIEGPTAADEGIVSPVHGIDQADLAKGLPPHHDHDDSGSGSNSEDDNFVMAKAIANKSTGSATVDHLEVRLSEEDMDDEEAQDKSTRARMEES